MSSTTLVRTHDPNERLAAIIAHAGTALAWFLAPLLVFLVLPRESRWARYHALQSLLWSLLGTLVSLLTWGIAIPIFLVWHVVAAYKTHRDGDYEYPLVGKAAHRAIYGDDA
ncbi:MAG TPA: DUF4870 domain-containing protein [Polyangiaceae bacterium]|jgi:uncharacterized membrane protein